MGNKTTIVLASIFIIIFLFAIYQQINDSPQIQEQILITAEPKKAIYNTTVVEQNSSYDISVIPAIDISKNITNVSSIKKQMTLSGRIESRFEGDSLIKEKRYYLVDDFANAIHMQGINANTYGKIILYKNIQRFEVSGTIVNYSSPTFTVEDLQPIPYDSFAVTVDEDFTPDQIKTFQQQYCNAKYILENAVICGCDDEEMFIFGGCTLFENTFEKSQQFAFVLNGKKHSINLTTYGGRRDLYRNDDAIYNDNDVKKRINDGNQTQLYRQIIEELRPYAKTDDDMVRAIASVVQNIPYDYPGFLYDGLANKYAYEVVYDNLGVCGDKSFLMIGLLKELGYGTAYLTFPEDNHAAVGIKCASEYDYKDTGYCFIESTTPSIITLSDGGDGISGDGVLGEPNVLEINYDREYTGAQSDYQDAQELIELQKIAARQGNKLDEDDYDRYQDIVEKYGLR